MATTRRKAEVTIEVLGLHFRFITLAPHKFFDIQTVTIKDQPVRITTPSKTLVDGLDRPDLCGGIVELAKGLARYVADGAHPATQHAPDRDHGVDLDAGGPSLRDTRWHHRLADSQ